MKRLLKVLALWGCLACAALAEQRVFVVTSAGTNRYTADVTKINEMLAHGWRVTHVSTGTTNMSQWIVFVLESPAPKEPVKP